MGSGRLLDLTTKERETIRQYLLGLAPEAGLNELEERILIDDSFYEELLIAEDELIDQYLLGALSELERSGFVSHFLITDERREKLRFSKSLRKYLNVEGEENALSESPDLVPAKVDPSPPRKWSFSFFPLTSHAAFRVSLATILLAVLLGVSWIVTRQVSPEKPSGKPPSIFVATLSPGLSRDLVETTEVSIPPDKDTVRLQLLLESSSDGYQSYSAELKTYENSTLLSRDKLQQNAHKLVILDVPAQILKVGYYQVRLSGVGESGTTETLGRYPFKVVK